MRVLIVKLGATGDVVRTTTILHRLPGSVTWLTAAKNKALLQDVREDLQCFSWEERDAVDHSRPFDLVINLEDTEDIGRYLQTIKFRQLFGAYLDGSNQLAYTEDSRGWFDLSLISVHGRKEADRLKLLNRQTYQALIFSGLGFTFKGETYQLPKAADTGLSGDVAIAPEGGPVWPMKNWAYYEELQQELETRGFKVNVLPKRGTLLEHLGDVQGHRCLVSGDSLPMHLAMGRQLRCVTLFTCTSPWEIYDYGIQRQIVSPLLAEYFYQRGYDRRATTAITVEEVLAATLEQLSR